MCIYTVKEQNLKKKILRGGGAQLHRTILKMGVSGVKDTAKTNKD